MEQPKLFARSSALATLFLLTAAILVSCGEESQFKALDKKNVEREVTQMLHDYHDAIRQDGLMAEFDFLDDSEDFFWVPPGYESALSYDSVRTILETNAPSIRSADYHWDTLRVLPLAPFIATFHGIVSGEVVSADDPSTPQAVRMIESGTAIRKLGRWKLLSGQTTNLLEPVEEDAPSLFQGLDSIPSTELPLPAPGDSIPNAGEDSASGDFI